MATSRITRRWTGGLLVAALVLASAPTAALDLQKLLQGVQGQGDATSSATTLSQGEIGQGLKEALSQGVQRAVKSLGRPDGFLGNPKVRIPMPESLSKVESALRAIGQDRYADQFVDTMNHAAEQAVPEAASIFGDAISHMTMEDARGILNGPDDAATEYFRRVSGDQLVNRFRPIVEKATDSAGVTSAYKNLVKHAGVVGQLLGKQSTDLDGYVTDKAVDGLFTVIAEEEKRIRTDPVARTTDLLKKVFQ